MVCPLRCKECASSGIHCCSLRPHKNKFHVKPWHCSYHRTLEGSCTFPTYTTDCFAFRTYTCLLWLVQLTLYSSNQLYGAVFIEKLIVAHSFMETIPLLPCSRDSASWNLHSIPLRHVLILSSRLRLGLATLWICLLYSLSRLLE
jgi:hypothetical protein